MSSVTDKKTLIDKNIDLTPFKIKQGKDLETATEFLNDNFLSSDKVRLDRLFQTFWA